MPFFITDKDGKLVEQIPTGQRQNVGSETGAGAQAQTAGTGTGTKTTANTTGAQTTGNEAGPTAAANAAGTPARTPAGTEANATATGAAQAGTGQTPQTRPRATTLAERQTLEQTAALMKQAKPVQLTPEEMQRWRQSVGTGTSLLPWPEDEPMPSGGRVAASGYAADMGPILAWLEAGRIDPEPYRREMERIDAMLPQAAEEYRRTGRNPLADVVLAGMKPKRNIDEEERLRQNAKLLALNNALSLIGKGIAASAGIRPTPIDNKPIYDIQARLRQLDDIYRQEGLRYDQNRLLSALRKDQANQQAAQAAVEALQKQRDSYAGMYSDAIQNNRDIDAKMADKALEASKFSAEQRYKYDKLRSDEQTADKNRGVQWAKLKYEREKDEPMVIDNHTRKGIPLNRENRARLAMVASYLLEKKERARKTGSTFNFGFSGQSMAPYTPEAEGRNPKVLNNALTEDDWNALEKFTRDGTLSFPAQAVLGRIAGAVSKATEEGDLSGFGVPPIPERPNVTPKDPSDKKQVERANRERALFQSELAQTIQGQMEVLEMLNPQGGIPSPKAIRELNADDPAAKKIAPQDWNMAYREAKSRFLTVKRNQ